MKNVKDWQEPWKKQEPDSRAREKANRERAILERQAKDTHIKLTQSVKVTCLKNKLWQGDFYTSFNVKVNVPLSESEFMARMEKAFPECERRV